MTETELKDKQDKAQAENEQPQPVTTQEQPPELDVFGRPIQKNESKEDIDNKQEEQKQESIQKEENPQEINWKRFREERERERKAMQEAQEREKKKAQEAEALKQALEALTGTQSQGTQQTQQTQPELDYWGNPVQKEQPTQDPEAIKKEFERLYNEKEEERRRKEQEEEQRKLPEKLMQTHGDFYNVCTDENWDYICYKYPEIARPYQNMPNNFEKWDGIYKVIKRFMPNNSDQNKARADTNLRKPQSMSVPGSNKTADSAPSNLTDQRRAENWRRMQRIMKGG